MVDEKGEGLFENIEVVCGLFERLGGELLVEEGDDFLQGFRGGLGLIGYDLQS